MLDWIHSTSVLIDVLLKKQVLFEKKVLLLDFIGHVIAFSRGQLFAIVHKNFEFLQSCVILSTYEPLPYPISLPTGKCNAEM